MVDCSSHLCHGDTPEAIIEVYCLGEGSIYPFGVGDGEVVEDLR